MNNQIPLYALNGFLKFDRKLYQIFGLPLGRPIPFKTIIYAIVIGLIEIIIYFTPVLGKLISWIPPIILLIIPIGLAWLLSDIGTEDRSPVSFFKSFFLYQIRKVKGNSYYRSREIPRERKYEFNNYITCKTIIKLTPEEIIVANKNAEKERQRTLRYMERMKDPDDFFRKLRQKEELERQKRRKWFFFKKGA